MEGQIKGYDEYINKTSECLRWIFVSEKIICWCQKWKEMKSMRPREHSSTLSPSFYFKLEKFYCHKKSPKHQIKECQIQSDIYLIEDCKPRAKHIHAIQITWDTFQSTQQFLQSTQLIPSLCLMAFLTRIFMTKFVTSAFVINAGETSADRSALWTQEPHEQNSIVGLSTKESKASGLWVNSV